MYGSRGLGFVITRIEYVWNAVLTDPLPPAAKRARFDAAREREREIVGARRSPLESH